MIRVLELNLGLCWDYEINMLNNGYVMFVDRVVVLMVFDICIFSG